MAEAIDLPLQITMTFQPELLQQAISEAVSRAQQEREAQEQQYQQEAEQRREFEIAKFKSSFPFSAETIALLPPLEYECDGSNSWQVKAKFIFREVNFRFFQAGTLWKVAAAIDTPEDEECPESFVCADEFYTRNKSPEQLSRQLFVFIADAIEQAQKERERFHPQCQVSPQPEKPPMPSRSEVFQVFMAMVEAGYEAETWNEIAKGAIDAATAVVEELRDWKAHLT